MKADEVSVVVDYFHGSTPEHLETLGVDPTRLPSRHEWEEHFAREYARAREARKMLAVLWELDGTPIGFSTADKLVRGEQAHMHLHIVEPARRRSGLGVECVRRTAQLYFEWLALKRLFCEPSAFNVAPNRTLQRAGFIYVKTYTTVPGPLNYHQAVTRWELTPDSLAAPVAPPP